MRGEICWDRVGGCHGMEGEVWLVQISLVRRRCVVCAECMLKVCRGRWAIAAAEMRCGDLRVCGFLVILQLGITRSRMNNRPLP